MHLHLEASFQLYVNKNTIWSFHKLPKLPETGFCVCVCVFLNGNFTFWLSFCDLGKKIEEEIQGSNSKLKCWTVIILILVKTKYKYQWNMADEEGLGTIMLKNRLAYKMTVAALLSAGSLGDLVSASRHDMMLNRNTLAAIVPNFRWVPKIKYYFLHYLKQIIFILQNWANIYVYYCLVVSVYWIRF